VARVHTPFLKEAKKGKGCSPMSEGATQEYCMAVMMESGGGGIPMEELRAMNIPMIEILMKRVEVLKLPISFTPEGLVAAYAITENNPGRVVTLLIDCLTEHEGKTVNASMLADMYPFGFYSEETFTSYVDDYLKNPEVRPQVKWAEIY